MIGNNRRISSNNLNEKIEKNNSENNTKDNESGVSPEKQTRVSNVKTKSSTKPGKSKAAKSSTNTPVSVPPGFKSANLTGNLKNMIVPKEGKVKIKEGINFINNVSMFEFEAPEGADLYFIDCANTNNQGKMTGKSGTTASLLKMAGEAKSYLQTLSRACQARNSDNPLPEEGNSNFMPLKDDVLKGEFKLQDDFKAGLNKGLENTKLKDAAGIIRVYGADLNKKIGPFKVGKKTHDAAASAKNKNATFSGLKKMLDATKVTPGELKRICVVASIPGSQAFKGDPAKCVDSAMEAYIEAQKYAETLGIQLDIQIVNVDPPGGKMGGVIDKAVGGLSDPAPGYIPNPPLA
jgi:hypothetical protein